MTPMKIKIAEDTIKRWQRKSAMLKMNFMRRQQMDNTDKIKKVTLLSKEIEILEKRKALLQEDFNRVSALKSDEKTYKFKKDQDYSSGWYSAKEVSVAIGEAQRNNTIELNKKIKELQYMLKED